MEEKSQQETTQVETTPEEVAPIVSEVPEKTEKRWIKPLILSVLGVLVAASLVFGGYKLAQIRQVQPRLTPTPVVVPTPTPEPTTNWKTYTNTKYEYSIRYPKEWQVFEVKEGPEAGIRADFAESEALSGREWWVWIKVNNNPDELSAKQWVDRLLLQYSDQPAVIAGIKREKDRVADTEAERVTGLPAMTEMISVFIPEEKNIYEIVLQKGVGVLSDESKQTFNLMLSTFRFLGESDEAQIREVLDEYIPEHSLVKVFELEGLKILGNFAKVTIVPKDIVTDKAFVILEKGEGQWSVIWSPGTAIGKTDPVLEKIPEELLR